MVQGERVEITNRLKALETSLEAHHGRQTLSSSACLRLPRARSMAISVSSLLAGLNCPLVNDPEPGLKVAEDIGWLR